jgi:hypothetical protein
MQKNIAAQLIKTSCFICFLLGLHPPNDRLGAAWGPGTNKCEECRFPARGEEPDFAKPGLKKTVQQLFERIYIGCAGGER